MEHDVPPEADLWLDQAAEEFDRKQGELQADWLRDFTGWNFDPKTGSLSLSHENGSRSLAAAEILGLFNSADNTWEWAWNNADLPAQFSRRSLLVKAIGDRYELDYLKQGAVQIQRDHDEMISYFCSIGVKATEAAGIFRGGSDKVPVYFLLFDPKSIRASA